MLRKIFFYILILVIISPETILAEKVTDRMVKGIEYINTKNYNKAISEFKCIIDSGPIITNVYLCMGICYLNQGKFAQATHEFKQEIKLDSLSAQPHYFLAMISEYRNEKQKAIMYWQKFIKLTKNKKFKKIATKHIEHLKEK